MMSAKEQIAAVEIRLGKKLPDMTFREFYEDLAALQDEAAKHIRVTKVEPK